MDIPLEALKTFRYDGRTVAPGQAFMARSAKDAHLLTILKKAKRASRRGVPPPPPPIDDVVTVRVEMADDEPPKRRYRRRDLTAEPE